jgi:phosphatidylserine/phosphatidylglycerophosphate/cardiolipin synthase-like enzyme
MSLHKKHIDVLIIATIIIIFCIFGLTLFQMTNTEKIHYPTALYVSEHLAYYFMPQEIALEDIYRTLKEANDRIYCAFRSLNHEELENILFKKQQEGVDVKLMVDSDYFGNKRIHLPFVRFAPKGYTMMHATYCVVDSTHVIIGSTIWNQNTIDLNFQDILILKSPELVIQFEHHFNHIYHKQKYEDAKFAVSVDKSIITPYFCPMDDCSAPFLELINSAETSIDFAVYALTEPQIQLALSLAQERGVRIQGVVDRRGLTRSSVAFAEIEGVRISDFNRRLHTKIFVFDNQTMITGSLNPSIKGTEINDEAFIIIQNPEVSQIGSAFVTYVHSYRKVGQIT